MFTESTDHVMVVSAMSRLARCGGWERILQGKPLEDELDLLDADLLLAVGVLQRRRDESLEPVPMHPWCYDPPALAAGTLSLLRQALRYAEGDVHGWSGNDEVTLLAQGIASACTAGLIAELILPRMPEAHEALTNGPGAILDVGVGVGSFAITLCQTFPLSHAVGIDVLPEVVSIATERVEDAGLTHRIDLRQQSVADLSDEETFDLAWIPQAFIPPTEYRSGLAAVLRALRPGGWIVTLVSASRRAHGLQAAVQAHEAHLTGGGVPDVDDLVGLLDRLGFDRISELDSGDQTLVIARRPSDEALNAA